MIMHYLRLLCFFSILTALFTQSAKAQGYVLDAVLLKSTASAESFWVIEARVQPSILLQLYALEPAAEDPFDALLSVYNDSMKIEANLRGVAMDEPMDDRQIAELLFAQIGIQDVNLKATRHRLKLELVIASPVDTIQPWIELYSKTIVSYKKRASKVVSNATAVVDTERLTYLTLGDVGSKKIVQCAQRTFNDDPSIWSIWLPVDQSKSWMQQLGCDTRISAVDEQFISVFPIELVDLKVNRILMDQNLLRIPRGCFDSDPPCLVVPY